MLLLESANNQVNSLNRHVCSQSELDSSSLGPHSDDSVYVKLVVEPDQDIPLNIKRQLSQPKKIDLILKSENVGFVLKINCI